MRHYLTSLAGILLTGALSLGISGAARAQGAAQQSEEIPAQYPAQYPPRQYPPQQQKGPQPAGQPPAQAQSDLGAARVSFIHGDVSTQHGDDGEWAAATVNTPVVTGDHIATGQDSRAEVQLDYANILRMSDESTANVANLSPTQIQVQIGKGLVDYDVFKNTGANVEIDTPNAMIRPQIGEGRYRILVNSDGETIVDVRQGSAEISTPQGSTHVQKDQRITVEGTDNPQYQIARAIGKDDWDKWNDDRDHLISEAESWQHTNPYYTGSQDLDPYGQWNDVPGYGSVWFPAAGPDWAPYRDGRWVYEPYYGWTWVSYEPWGWAPYHYGRWFVYGGNWGWWSGPVYAGYSPLWAPAYVSFMGFGGGGFGFGFGFGFGGGFASIGWLPIGPGDRFYPWYGRGAYGVNGVNIRNNFGGGLAPLRQGPNAFSNLNRAAVDAQVRGGISSMQSSQFGRGRVPAQQQRFDAGSFRQASVLRGSLPVAASRESGRSTDRAVNTASLPNHGNTNQRFYTGSRAAPQQQAGAFNRSGNVGANGPQQNGVRPSQGNNQVQRSIATPAERQNNSGSIGSAGNWRTYTPPSRPAQSVQSPGQSQSYSRGSSGSYGYSRPALNMQQPIVTPRTRSYSAPSSVPSGGGYRGAPSAVQSRGGSSGGGSRAPSGGRSSSGHGRH